MKKKWKSFWTGDHLCYLIFFLLCCILLHSYFWTGSNYASGDDSPFHLTNIHVLESTLDFLHMKFIPSPILPEIANNLGYGVGLFYPRLPHLVAAYITHILSPLGANAAIGLKISHFLVLFLSGTVIYHFVDKVISNKKAGFFAGVFYMSSAYTISDIIIRDAYAECFQFLFFPMILLGLYELFNGKKSHFYFYFILGYLGLINSHLVVSIFLTIAILIYLFAHLKEVFQWKNLKHLLLASGIIIILFLPSVVPMLEHRLYGNYAVFQENLMSSVRLVESCAVHPLSFIIPFWHWENIHFFISGVVLVLLGVVIFHRKELFKTIAQKKILITFLIMAILFFFMASKLAPWKYAPSVLLMIQFPWRLEIVLVFATSYLASAFFLLPKKKYQVTIDICILLISMMLGVTAITHPLNLITDEYRNQSKLSEYGMGWSKEYLPVSTLKNAKEYLYQKNDIVVLEGDARVTELNNEVPNATFKIETTTKTTIEFPRLFYFGYQIKQQTASEQKEINYQESEHGMIQMTLDESGTVLITYPGTKAYQVTNIVRFGFIIIGGVTFLIYKKKEGK